MRLLVSVRSAVEAAAALGGGADIVDAKEPRRGSLSPVSASVLREIVTQVPEPVPLSVALGELATTAEATRALELLDLEPRAGGTFLKLGFAGGSSEHLIRELLATAVAAAAVLRCRPRLVAVAYADHARALLPSPGTVLRIAIDAGVSGVLLDTAVKDGRGLTSWMPAPVLAAWVSRARRAGLLSALAGSLDHDALGSALAAGPDVIGVRGAACSGGRNGIVQTGQVRALVSIVANARLAKRQVSPWTRLVAGPSSN